MTKIRKAVFPVAGLGARFLPATKVMPKELLPVIDRPIIQYAVEEAVAARITDLIFATGRTKRAIEDHFDANPELERSLRDKGKEEVADMLRNIVPELDFVHYAVKHNVSAIRMTLSGGIFSCFRSDGECWKMSPIHKTSLTAQIASEKVRLVLRYQAAA